MGYNTVVSLNVNVQWNFQITDNSIITHVLEIYGIGMVP